MDEPTIEIKRDDLLKLGGTSVLAALLAVLGGAEPAAAEVEDERRHSHRFSGTPIGLDFTTTDPLESAGQKTSGGTVIKHVIVSKTADLYGAPAIQYHIKHPSYDIEDQDGSGVHNKRLPYDLYFYIWT